MLNNSKKCAVLILILLGQSTAHAQNAVPDAINDTCQTQSAIQQNRSAELAGLVDDDQKDRENWDNLSDQDKMNVSNRDLKRRMRVGEIFGEGCFKLAADYSAASLIYQHGDVPDHYFQAFIWANHAVRLGDLKQKRLVALTLDRYLVSIGNKQLFGSQAYASDETNWCYCLQPVESSFPDVLRLDYLNSTLSQQYEWLLSINQENNNCPNIACPTELKPTPQGSVLGVW